MRVIGGSARGHRLTVSAGREIRPTPDRVREALFSILFSRCGPLAGCSVLDLFAGSGALGIEALSRGAGHAWFVDRSPKAAAIIRQNLEHCGLAARATVMTADLWSALPALANNAPYALIFADPPYGDERVPLLLQEVSRHGLLAVDGLLCLETAVTDPVPDQAGTLQLIDRRRYGTTRLHFFHHPGKELA